MRASSFVLVAALALAGGCEKKSSPAEAGAAPVVLPPSARAATAGTAGGTDAVHTPLLAFLPPFATVYTWMDAGALAGAEPSGSPRETMLAAVPAACRDAVTSVREAAWGAYVEEPSGFVLALYGPTVEAVRACAAGRLGLIERGVRAETPSGRELLICEGPGGALISVDAATHVVATAGRVPATLAALDGGLSLVDDPVVAPLADLPAGALAIATQYTAGEAQRFARVLSAIGETAEAPLPAALAITIGAGRPSRITAALVLSDEVAATMAEGIVRHGLERLGADRARVQDWTAKAAAAGRPETRILAELGSLFDSLVVSRAGSAVRLAGQTSLRPTEFSILLTGTLLPALLSLAR